MNAPADYAFDERQVRLILPHRPPMLMVDRVQACAPSLEHLAAVKSIGTGEPMLTRAHHGSAHFPPVLIVEALAQSCGFLMNLRWLAGRGVDLAAFACGDDSAVLAQAVPHSVLAETRMRQLRMVRVGDCLQMAVRIKMQRAQMLAFTATATCRAGVCTELEVLLAFPDYTAEVHQ